MEPPPAHIRDKQRRKLAIAERALAALDEFRRRDADTRSQVFGSAGL
jgi:hypothetical protein